MIAVFLLESFLSVLRLFLNALPFIRDFNVPVGALDALLSILDIVSFFVPMGTVSVIFSFWLAYESFKIVMSILKFILKLCPFIG